MGKVGNLLFWSCILLVHYITVSSFLFVADGSGFFIEMLQTHNFIVHEPLRQFARYITQFPLILGLNFGVTNFKILVLLFGLGHCLHTWFSVAAVYWLAGWQTAKRIMVVPLIILVISGGFLISESFVVASYSLVIGIGLINWHKLTTIKQVFIAIICSLFFNLYEGGFINGIGLIAMGLFHFSIKPRAKNSVNRFLEYLVLVLLSINTVFMVFRAVIEPLNSNGAQVAELNPWYFLGISFCVGVWWLMLKLFPSSWVVIFILTVTAIFGVYYLPSDINSAYTDRILSLLLPTTLMLVESFEVALGHFKLLKDREVGKFQFITVFVCALLLFKTVPTLQHQFSVAHYCNSNKGVLGYDKVKNLYSPNYEIWWTNIYTSIIYQGFIYGSVNSITGNPTKCDFCYNVLDYKTYPDLREFGIEYHKSLVP